jgi:hypothetical protein
VLDKGSEDLDTERPKLLSILLRVSISNQQMVLVR